MTWSLVPFAASPSASTATIISEPSTVPPRSQNPAASTLTRTARLRPRTHRATKPSQVKALGRMVQAFDDGVWAREREHIMLSDILYKLRQHAGLRAAPLATGARELVEASPRDRGGDLALNGRRRRGWAGKLGDEDGG